MLTIRLSRVGKKNKPMYRLIISEKARDPYGRALEILGSYNPHSKTLQVKGERVKYWISKGAGMSPTVNNLLLEKGVIEGEKVKASKVKSKKKASEKKENATKETSIKNEASTTENEKKEEALNTDSEATAEEVPKEKVKEEQE